ncbi:uncharacterized protein [Montipora foliosa]|uniref:uncharacterized protein n=1 Tax=Montipora foliosa TaxID=591990 RepID=UPI0035F17980
MPPIRSRRAVRAQNNVNMDPAVLSALPISDLRGLCQQNGLPSTGQRSTLERRLTSLRYVPANNADGGPNGEASGLNLNNHMDRPQDRNSIFSEAQIAELQRLVKESVAVASTEIAGEAARAAVGAIQAQSVIQPSTQNSARTSRAIDVDTLIQTHPHQDITFPDAGLQATPFQDPIPTSYVKEIQSGEFFELSKLLPKNLSNVEDEPLVLSIENSVVTVTKNRKASSTITDVEQWTTAFTIYLRVLTHKFPHRSQELLHYLSLIRYAARVHAGLGWAIYDYKFRQKASLNKSLVWSILDTQLWLTVFTVAPSVLREEYPLFSKRPNSRASDGVASRGTCNNFNSTGSCTRESCPYKHVCNKCRGAHPGCHCPDRSRVDGKRHSDAEKDPGASHPTSSRRPK